VPFTFEFVETDGFAVQLSACPTRIAVGYGHKLDADIAVTLLVLFGLFQKAFIMKSPIHLEFQLSDIEFPAGRLEFGSYFLSDFISGSHTASLSL
jgi:hypothetical protein